METNPFWSEYEQFRQQMADGDTDGARRHLYAMTQWYPQLSDNDLEGNKAIIHAALALDKALPNFNLAYFVPYAMRLADTDWAGRRVGSRVVPSLGQRITNRLMSNLQERSNEYIKGAMPFFRKALQINPSNKDNLRHLAQLYVRVGLKSQAVMLYKRLLQSHHDSYLYAELAELMPLREDKISLLCQAIVRQGKEAFNCGYRYRLALLLQFAEPTRAAYEIRKSVAARKRTRQPLPADVERVDRLMTDFTPVTDDEERRYYQQQAERVQRIINNENE